MVLSSWKIPLLLGASAVPPVFCVLISLSSPADRTFTSSSELLLSFHSPGSVAWSGLRTSLVSWSSSCSPRSVVHIRLFSRVVRSFNFFAVVVTFIRLLVEVVTPRAAQLGTPDLILSCSLLISLLGSCCSFNLFTCLAVCASPIRHDSGFLV